jgi:D-3-phosphoglycerate dehydrogenase
MEPSLPLALVLGHRFASLDIERATLAGIAEILDGNTLQGERLADALRAASVVMLGTRGRLDTDTIAAMPNCRAIIRYGIGVDNVAVARATAQGIPVINIPEYCIHEVSDHTVALILAVNRRLIPAQEAATQGRWGPAVMHGTPRLATLTVGIVGFGRIGQEVARKMLPLVARVLVYDPFVPDEQVLDRDAIPASFDDLLRNSDFVTVNCPLTEATRHLFNAETLAKIKPAAWLINTARGEIIEEDDLIEALELGRIQGVALDVLTDEPPAPDSPLLRMPNAIVTPHVAWYSEDALHDLQRLAAVQARRVLTGEPPHWVVNPRALSGTLDDRRGMDSKGLAREEGTP